MTAPNRSMGRNNCRSLFSCLQPNKSKAEPSKQGKKTFYVYFEDQSKNRTKAKILKKRELMPENFGLSP